MGVFGKIKDSKATLGGNYFEPWFDWWVVIDRVKNDKTRKNVDNFIVECRVIECKPNNSQAKAAPAPGAPRSWYVGLDKDAALGNIKQFMGAAGQQCGEWTEAQLDEVDQAGNSIGEQLTDWVCSPEQPLSGLIIFTTSWNKPTQAGNPFTRHKWEAIVSSEVARLEKRAVELGIKPPAGAQAATGTK